MKNTLLTFLICLPAFSFSQSPLPSVAPEMTQATEDYAAHALDAEAVRDLIMRVTDLDSDQANKVLEPFLRVIVQARETHGTIVMDEQTSAYFTKNWSFTEAQIENLGKVAARFAGAEGDSRRQ